MRCSLQLPDAGEDVVADALGVFCVPWELLFQHGVFLMGSEKEAGPQSGKQGSNQGMIPAPAGATGKGG